MLYSYATLDQLKTLITADINDAVNNDEFYNAGRDAQIMAFARLASERVRAWTQYDFVPHAYSWSVYGKQLWHILSRQYNALKLPAPLVQLDACSIAGEAQDISALVAFAEMPNEPPEYLSWVNVGSWRVTGNESIVVSGLWCYRRDYPNAWVDSGDTVVNAGGIDAVERVIEVADVAGLDDNGLAPRFSIGQVIRVGNEMMVIMGIDAVDDELTVKRGALGSTKATHAEGAAIEAFTVEPDIVRATALIISANLANIDNHTSATVSDLGVVQTIFVPDEAMTILSLYAKKTTVGGW